VALLLNLEDNLPKTGLAFPQAPQMLDGVEKSRGMGSTEHVSVCWLIIGFWIFKDPLTEPEDAAQGDA
jgi:hypothetical protein